MHLGVCASIYYTGQPYFIDGSNKGCYLSRASQYIIVDMRYLETSTTIGVGGVHIVMRFLVSQIMEHGHGVWSQICSCHLYICG
jgi:hypothetical protein